MEGPTLTIDTGFSPPPINPNIKIGLMFHRPRGRAGDTSRGGREGGDFAGATMLNTCWAYERFEEHMDLLGSLLKWAVSPVGGWFTGWLGRFRLLQLLPLYRYRRQLARRYGTFTPKSGPARSPLSMQEMYLPLRVESAGRQPVGDVVAEHRRLIVTGEPGTGKSMLLRHLAFEFAARRATGRIPFLLELQRFADTGRDLRGHLTDELARNGFFRVERFVDHGLADGTFLILLDGLDEVGHAHRAAAVRQILAFLSQYPECAVVITCRTAVREKALLAEVHTVAMAELDDQLIAEYIRKRLGLRPASIATLLRELFDHPRVLALARVPLLLDMMITIYADGGGVRFPASRAQFYGQAVEFLLTPWHAEHTTDPDRIEDMRRVLRCLALINHDDPRGDCLTLERDSAVSSAAALLDLGRIPTRELLTEIVERSGLLVRADGGYRFAHLTFQEFLAAESLRDDATGLVRRFRTDRDRWLEPVVLWCRTAPNPTEIIEALLADRSPVALQCLSEAGPVDRALVCRIIREFGEQLGNPAVARAFGIAAATSDLVFEFLEGEIDNAQEPDRRVVAAGALAASNLPRAAASLGVRYDARPEVRAALVRMRDFAVDMLAAAVRPDDVGPLDILQTIGTPAAAHAMIPLLWHTDEHLAAAAAWRLAVLLRDQTIADSLAQYRLEPRPKDSHRYAWVWEPFADDGVTGAIVSRICELLKEGSDSAVPNSAPPIDARLAVALGLVGGRSLRPDRHRLIVSSTGRRLMAVADEMGEITGEGNLGQRLADGIPATLLSPGVTRGWVPLQRRFLTLLFRILDWPERDRLLLKQAPLEHLTYLLRHGDRSPTEQDWRRMLARGPQLRPLIAAGWTAAVVVLVTQVPLTIAQSSRSGAWIMAPMRWILARVADVGQGIGQFWTIFWSGRGMFGIQLIPGFGVTGDLLLLVLFLWLMFAKGKSAGLALLVTLVIAVAFVAAWVVLTVMVLLLTMPTAWLHDVTGSWWGVTIAWLGALTLPTLAVLAKHRQRVWDRNPLRDGLPEL